MNRTSLSICDEIFGPSGSKKNTMVIVRLWGNDRAPWHRDNTLPFRWETSRWRMDAAQPAAGPTVLVTVLGPTICWWGTLYACLWSTASRDLAGHLKRRWVVGRPFLSQLGVMFEYLDVRVFVRCYYSALESEYSIYIRKFGIYSWATMWMP